MTGGFVMAAVAVVLLILAGTPEYDRPAGSVAAAVPRPSATPVIVVETSLDAAPVPDSLPPEELTGYSWPLRAARVLTWFGPDEQGFLKTDEGRIHEGIDLVSRCDAPVMAAHKGKVVAAGRDVLGAVGFEANRKEIAELQEKHITPKKGDRVKDVLPITVVIDDGNGYRSLYKHLADVAVEPGQNVKAGTVIGTTGQSGGVTRCQVQYELARMDAGWQRVAREEIERMGYPKWIRERVDPLRVLSLGAKGAPRVSRRNPPPGTASSSGTDAAATGRDPRTSPGMHAGPEDADAATASGMRAAAGPGATSSGMRGAAAAAGPGATSSGMRGAAAGSGATSSGMRGAAAGSGGATSSAIPAGAPGPATGPGSATGPRE
jgi:murein DD-endopeptidase MepM/ murein hydrolase activator NlpD